MHCASIQLYAYASTCFCFEWRFIEIFFSIWNSCESNRLIRRVERVDLGKHDLYESLLVIMKKLNKIQQKDSSWCQSIPHSNIVRFVWVWLTVDYDCQSLYVIGFDYLQLTQSLFMIEQTDRQSADCLTFDKNLCIYGAISQERLFKLQKYRNCASSQIPQRLPVNQNAPN